MNKQVDYQPGLVRTHSETAMFWMVPIVLGVMGFACFASGALVPIGAVLIPIAILLGLCAWAWSAFEMRYEKTHHYDITNEDED